MNAPARFDRQNPRFSRKCLVTVTLLIFQNRFECSSNKQSTDKKFCFVCHRNSFDSVMRQLSCGAIRNIPRVRAAILRQSTEALDSSLMSQIGGMIRRDFHILKALALRKLKSIFSQKHCRFDFSDFGRLCVGNHGKGFYKKFS